MTDFGTLFRMANVSYWIIAISNRSFRGLFLNAFWIDCGYFHNWWQSANQPVNSLDLKQSDGSRWHVFSDLVRVSVYLVTASMDETMRTWLTNDRMTTSHSESTVHHPTREFIHCRNLKTEQFNDWGGCVSSRMLHPVTSRGSRPTKRELQIVTHFCLGWIKTGSSFPLAIGEMETDSCIWYFLYRGDWMAFSNSITWLWGKYWTFQRVWNYQLIWPEFQSKRMDG